MYYRKVVLEEASKVRRCLSCTETFSSEWAGDRICKDCKRSSEWRRGLARSQAEMK